MTHYGTIAEYWACREKAVIMDLSPLRKYEVIGIGAEELLQTMCNPEHEKTCSRASGLYRHVL